MVLVVWFIDLHNEEKDPIIKDGDTNPAAVEENMQTEIEATASKDVEDTNMTSPQVHVKSTSFI